MRKTATIALDIDGTLIEKDVGLSSNVKRFIESLEKQGHCLVFNTGRSYHFAKRALYPFTFEYLLAVQNGAEVLSMPSHKIFHQELIGRDSINHLEKALEGIDGDFLIYAGYEKGDFCYFRPHNFSPQQLVYLEFLKALTPIDWIALDSFDDLPQETFPLIKCIGTRDAMQKCQERLEVSSSLKVCLIEDRMSYFSILMVTHKNASKGDALEKLLELDTIKRPIIVAGDDMNDLSMFKVADISIAMKDGAQALIEKADIIAPAASSEGIITGIQEALKKL
jgi:Cof subfamily protein (haloacid dehalogenase superfamily)